MSSCAIFLWCWMKKRRRRSKNNRWKQHEKKKVKKKNWNWRKVFVISALHAMKWVTHGRWHPVLYYTCTVQEGGGGRHVKFQIHGYTFKWMFYYFAVVAVCTPYSTLNAREIFLMSLVHVQLILCSFDSFYSSGLFFCVKKASKDKEVVHGFNAEWLAQLNGKTERYFTMKFHHSLRLRHSEMRSTSSTRFRL